MSSLSSKLHPSSVLIKSGLALAAALLGQAPVMAQQTAYAPTSSLGSAVVASEGVDGWVMRKQVNEVAVMFTAKFKGQFVGNLEPHDIQVKEDKKDAGAILDFRNEANLPLRLAMLVDTSGSVDQRFSYEQSAAKKFLQHVLARPADEAFIMHFSQKPQLAQEFSADTSLLTRAISQLHDDHGATAIFDAVSAACRKLASHAESDRVARVLVLVTDGDDNSSKLHLEEALARAQDSEVTIYTLSTSPADWNPRGNDVMRTLAQHTGGRVFFPESKRDFAKAFTQIGDDLRNRYAIAYKPRNFEPDGRFHKISITAKKFGKRLRVHARPGYFAR
jgi:Ca-activated chloride channel homolog